MSVTLTRIAFSCLLMACFIVRASTFTLCPNPINNVPSMQQKNAQVSSSDEPSQQRRLCFSTSLKTSSSSSETSPSPALATLTEATTWNLRLVLQNLPTAKGRTSNQMFVFRGKFIEEEGYEPPQGVLRQVADTISSEQQQPQCTITNSRWILSEDPEDRKDSLWIWGLFKEPLYPFLLLQMEIDKIELPGEEGDYIPAFKLFAQINHKRDNGEVILSPGADLKIKKKETVNADPFGAAKVDIFEEISVGKIQLQSITKS